MQCFFFNETERKTCCWVFCLFWGGYFAFFFEALTTTSYSHRKQPKKKQNYRTIGLETLAQGQECLYDSSRYCVISLKIVSESSTLSISSDSRSTVLLPFSYPWFQWSSFQIMPTSSSCFLRNHGQN